MKQRESAVKHRIRLLAGIPGLPEAPEQEFPAVAGTLLLIHTLLVLALQLLASLWPALADWLRQDDLIAIILHAVLMQGGLILVPTLFVIFYYELPDIGLIGERIRPGSLILAAMVGVPAAVVFSGLNNLLIYMLASAGLPLPAATSPTGSYASQLTDSSWHVVVLVILTSVLVPAVVEELMFRGVIQIGLANRVSSLAALIWQALAFALFHSDPLFILPPLLAGLLLGYLRLRSESLWPPIVAHASLNATLLALTPILPRLTARYLKMASQTTRSILFASLIATLVAAVALIPLLFLIANLRPAGHTGEQGRAWFSRDWKFALAMGILVVTMIVVYLQSAF